MSFQPSPFRLRAVSLAAVLLLAACGGDAGDAKSNARPEDVDQDAPAEVTEREANAFRAPADSVLSPEQIDRYLKTAILQFDLLRKEAPELYARANKMEERAKDDGMLSGLKNFADAAGWLAEYGDLVGGSFIRSARSLGYNPAEMEWVRERMGEVSGYLMVKPFEAMGAEMAKTQRQMAESMKSMISEEEYRTMIAQADSAEAAAAKPSAEGAVLRNFEVLKKSRPNVTDDMWMAVAMAGATGLLGLPGLADPNDSTAQRQMNEWRAIYQAALENRAMEVGKN
jgi:hypothetical protein